MSNYIITGFTEQNYLNKKGEEVSRLDCHSFTNDVRKNPNRKGFICSSSNVYPHLALSDFSEIPGKYTFEFKQQLGFKGKPVPVLYQVDHVGSFNVISKPGLYLLLSALKYDFYSEGNRLRGVSLSYLDPNSPTNLGYPIFKKSCQLSFEKFPVVPGYYDLSFVELPNSKGGFDLFINDASFAEKFEVAAA